MLLSVSFVVLPPERGWGGHVLAHDYNFFEGWRGGGVQSTPHFYFLFENNLSSTSSDVLPVRQPLPHALRGLLGKRLRDENLVFFSVNYYVAVFESGSQRLELPLAANYGCEMWI